MRCGRVPKLWGSLPGVKTGSDRVEDAAVPVFVLPYSWLVRTCNFKASSSRFQVSGTVATSKPSAGRKGPSGKAGREVKQRLSTSPSGARCGAQRIVAATLPQPKRTSSFQAPKRKGYPVRFSVLGL